MLILLTQVQNLGTPADVLLKHSLRLLMFLILLSVYYLKNPTYCQQQILKRIFVCFREGFKKKIIVKFSTMQKKAKNDTGPLTLVRRLL